MEDGYSAEDIRKTVLTPKNLARFYKDLLCLRFPIKVSDVLDLRYLINNSVDNYRLPFDIPGYSQFREALRSAIESFGIENERHYSRLLNILAMFRDLHYSHSIESRDAETRLRDAIRKNREARRRSLRYGIYSVVISATAGLVWFMLIQPGWLIKLVTFTMAYIAWDYFHSLSALERDLAILKESLSKVIRKRLNSIDWKMLIHKLSLILGYKQIKGVEVFHIEQDAPSAVH
jgi:hypothetical protein